jgi:hypothetical protein
MDGQWEWSESGDEPDTGDTADLGGDPGYGQGYEHGFEQGHTFDGHDGHDGHDDFGGGDPHGGDDLEEPLGTEHAAEAYDQSVDQSAHDGDGFDTADGDPAQHAGYEPVTDHTTDTGDDGHDGVDALQHAETFGSDPDLRGGDGWPEPVFPEELHLDSPPEPVDGFPWSDADALGGADHSLSAAYDPAVHQDLADPSGLAGYDGVDVPPGADAWSLLLSSEDPATSSLAGFWAPNT